MTRESRYQEQCTNSRDRIGMRAFNGDGEGGDGEKEGNNIICNMHNMSALICVGNVSWHKY